MAEIRDWCDDEGGVLVVTLGELRDAVAAGKLGVHVMTRIARELKAAGLGYFPLATLEDNESPRQGEELRVYLTNSPAAPVIEAVLHPSKSGDKRLTEVGGDETREVLDRIRELVCEVA